MLGETCSLAFRGCGGRKSESHLTYTNTLNLPWNKWNHPSTLKVTVLKSPRLNRTRNCPTSAWDFFFIRLWSHRKGNYFWAEPGTFCPGKRDVQLTRGQLSLTAGPVPSSSGPGSPYQFPRFPPGQACLLPAASEPFHLWARNKAFQCFI